MAPSSKVPRFRTLMVWAAVVVIATLLARGWAAWTLRAYTLEGASRDVSHIATVLAAQVAQSVKAIDAPLALLQQQLADRQPPSADQFRGASAEPDQALRAVMARLPPAADFAIADAQGHVVDHSESWPDAERDLTGHDFVAALWADHDGGLHVSAVSIRRSEDEKTLLFWRPVRSRQGELLGAAVIKVGAGYFKPIAGAIDGIADASFALVHTDGSILMRYPEAPDAEPRLVAATAVPNTPLVVEAAEPEAAILFPWRRIAGLIAAASALTLVCFALLLRILYLQFCNLSAAQASLAERENALGRQSHELARANTQIDAALNNMSQGLCMFDAAGALVIRNERYLRTYGMPSDVVTPGITFVDTLEHQRAAGNFSGDPQQFAADLRGRLAQGQVVNSTQQLADGRVIEVTSEPMIGGGWVATHDDITERRRSEARIARMARYDSLTDLANRVLFREKANAALESYKATGVGYSIFIFDLDLFKSVNDSLGHPVGDALLKAVAARLQGLTGEADTAGRIGGDEFAILHVAAGDQRDGASNLAKRLLEVIGAPYEIDGHHIVIGTSVGIAMAPYHGTDNEKLLKNADLALYRAKSDGRNSYRFFEAEMDRELQLRRTLEVDLNCAVENGEFEAHYQPVVNADTGSICAVEALIRWQHPRDGIVAPGRFIPIAEERGLITAIDRWMLQRACRDAMAWPDHIRVAVNMSPIAFRSGDLFEMITDALACSGLPPARLELEITESVLLQKSERNLAILHRIKKLGVSIVLDDFGTGYSSLGYLRLFPFDKIKVDQSFVREMPYRTDCAAIVCAIANLGRELDMVTVAEGVETAEQLALVRAAGCKQAQGFLFSRPVPASQLTFSGGDGVASRRLASA
ncbi:MAG TPA: EAL domain-containing protein [Xanthobacteraceae bacterium]